LTIIVKEVLFGVLWTEKPNWRTCSAWASLNLLFCYFSNF